MGLWFALLPEPLEARWEGAEDRLFDRDHQQETATASEGELILRAQRGEEVAFEALFHAHKRRVYALCLHMVGNAAEAEELMQEAFLQLFRKIHTFRNESAFSTWLHRLTANIVLMRLRKKNSQGNFTR